MVERIHTALKKATELDIEIGVLNTPPAGASRESCMGASPKNGDALSDLVGNPSKRSPRKVSLKLDKPVDQFQDVRVIAYPAPKGDGVTLNASNASVVSAPQVAGIAKVIDGDPKTSVDLPKDERLTIDLKAEHPVDGASLTVRPAERSMSMQGELQVKENDAYRTLSRFTLDRLNTALNVGFDPDAPVIVSIPATTGTDFRLVLTEATGSAGLAEATLSEAPRVERYQKKNRWPRCTRPRCLTGKTISGRRGPVVDDPATAVDPASVQDISQYMAEDGTLTWDAPRQRESRSILRNGHDADRHARTLQASPEATGFEIDKTSREHVRLPTSTAAIWAKFCAGIPAEDRKRFGVVVQDSYETGGQNFTDGMIEEFKTRYGYDPTPYLPVYEGVVVGSQEASDRFLWDVRRMVADKVAYDYVGGLRDVSHEHGLHTWLENYGHWGFPGEFLMYGGQSDEIGGEFWSEGELGDIENRAASSCGHIYGKRKISAESNTAAAAPFTRYPRMMKQRSDRFFAEGINNTLLHVYISQPDDREPGINAWFSNEFNRTTHGSLRWMSSRHTSSE